MNKKELRKELELNLIKGMEEVLNKQNSEVSKKIRKTTHEASKKVAKKFYKALKLVSGSSKTVLAERLEKQQTATKPARFIKEKPILSSAKKGVLPSNTKTKK
jgi:hypothetical protein